MNTAIETPKAGRREWIGLAVIALPCLLYAMDLTVLNLALPRISEDLRPSSAELLWIVDIYGFFVAGLLITMGSLGDRIGRRRLLLLGAAGFGVASVLAALSRTTWMLIGARALLGVAGATLAPSTLSLIRTMFLDARQRAVAIGVWFSSYSVGSAVGPVLGGLMLQRFWWGSVFLLGVPVMALLLVVGPRLLPEYRDPAPRRTDLPSALLSLLAVLSLIYGVKAIAQDGLGWPSVVAIAAGVALAVAFARRQRRLVDPLIDLELFRVRAFSASLAIYLLGTLVAFGSYVLIGQYLQLVLGLSPLAAGLWLLPWSVGFIVGSTVTPALARRVRPALVMGVGFAAATVGLVVIAQVSGAASLLVGTIVFSLGLAPAVTVGTNLIVGTAPRERAGAAAAISETSAELGGALGIAILGSIGTAIYRGDMARAALAGVPEATRLAARDTVGGATSAAAQLPGALGARLLETARASFTHTLHVTLVICAVLSALTAVVAVVLLRRVPALGDGESLSLNESVE
ncbi:MAG TPA: MFS transporter [Polyangia bacterium]|nr:MFS transporter [Polyangia bacterium]